MLLFSRESIAAVDAEVGADGESALVGNGAGVGVIARDEVDGWVRRVVEARRAAGVGWDAIRAEFGAVGIGVGGGIDFDLDLDLEVEFDFDFDFNFNHGVDDDEDGDGVDEDSDNSAQRFGSGVKSGDSPGLITGVAEVESSGVESGDSPGLITGVGEVEGSGVESGDSPGLITGVGEVEGSGVESGDSPSLITGVGEVEVEAHASSLDSEVDPDPDPRREARRRRSRVLRALKMAPPAVLARPALETLERKASWLNRAGAVDRSACFELRAAEVWGNGYDEEIAFEPFEWRPGVRREWTDEDALFGHELPDARWREVFQVAVEPARHEATALVWIGETTVARRDDRRLPRVLKGDRRTRKSNAMRAWGRNQPKTGPGEVAENPNRGATRLKRVGLPSPSARPGRGSSGGAAGMEDGLTASGRWAQLVEVQRWSYPRTPEWAGWEDVLMVKRVSKIPRRRVTNFLVCPKCGAKKLKLFTPYAYEAELCDAAKAFEFLWELRRLRKGKRAWSGRGDRVSFWRGDGVGDRVGGVGGSGVGAGAGAGGDRDGEDEVAVDDVERAGVGAGVGAGACAPGSSCPVEAPEWARESDAAYARRLKARYGLLMRRPLELWCGPCLGVRYGEMRGRRRHGGTEARGHGGTEARRGGGTEARKGGTDDLRLVI
ncbi:MAG: hypothetical protein ACF8PN_07640 [Phycisphaerales bacterium]